MNTATKVSVKTKDGGNIEVEYADLGYCRPAYDARGVAYAAYTTKFRINGYETYIQTDLDKIEHKGRHTMAGMRAAATRSDLDFLASENIDIDGLTWPPADVGTLL